MKNKGVTLLELIVASSLMGILFFSGLQLLSSLFAVEARYIPHPGQEILEPLALETRLRILLQSAEQLELQQSGHVLRFQQAQTPHQLQLKSTGTQWQVVLDQQVLAETRYRANPAIGFKQTQPNLLTIQLPDQSEPISIWLRNQS